MSGWIEKAGRRALLLPGDLKDPAYGRSIVARTVETFGRLDVLVNNGAFHSRTRASTPSRTRSSRTISARTCSARST